MHEPDNISRLDSLSISDSLLIFTVGQSQQLCSRGGWSRPRRARGGNKPGWSRCGLLHWSFLVPLAFALLFQEFIETLVGFIHSFFSTALDHSVPVCDRLENCLDSQPRSSTRQFLQS